MAQQLSKSYPLPWGPIFPNVRPSHADAKSNARRRRALTLRLDPIGEVIIAHGTRKVRCTVKYALGKRTQMRWFSYKLGTRISYKCLIKDGKKRKRTTEPFGARCEGAAIRLLS